MMRWIRKIRARKQLEKRAIFDFVTVGMCLDVLEASGTTVRLEDGHATGVIFGDYPKG